MNSSFLLSLATFIYGLASVLYIVSWVFKKQQPGKAASWVLAAGAAANVVGIVFRWIESYQLGIGRAPLSNLYESLVFFSLAISLFYLYMERRYRNRILGAFAAPLAFLSIAYASLSPDISDRIAPLIPALKSNWLIVHVVTCFLGYSAFAVAFGISIMYLIKNRDPNAKSLFFVSFPGLEVLDEMTHQMVVSGFLFLTTGIITGAVWANSAWGTYWSWDPKETWSLITWFVYATLLHARMMRGWYGKRIAYISIIGFCAVIFTYFGVNFLPGLHSYGK
jgi:cytochrome c-type biogenesis protein CcsB